MKRLQKLVSCLDAAIQEEGTEYLSIWSKKRYFDLFDYGPQGLGHIKFAEIAPLFSLRHDATPKEVEQALCAEFEEYNQSGFFKKLWWYFTKPVDLYKKIYALTHLRDLKANYLSIQVQAANTNDTHYLFLALLKPLTDYLRSYLPSFETMNQITREQSMSTHEQMHATLIELKSDLIRDYNGFFYGLMIKKNNLQDQGNLNDLINNIESWNTKLENELKELMRDNQLPSDYRKEYQALIDQLDSMYLILSAINRYQHDPNINAFPQAEEAKLDIHTDHYNYPSFFQKIEHDCAVYIIDKNNPQPIESYTYTLTHDNNTNWMLSYCGKDLNNRIKIPLNKVDNLVNILTNEPNYNAIKPCIFAYHASLVNTAKKPNPIERNNKAVDAAPPMQIMALLCDYSLNVSAKKIKEGNIDPEEIIAELIDYSVTIHEERNPYMNTYLAMCGRLKLQKNQYENVIDFIVTNSNAFQTKALSYAFDNQNISPNELRSHLTTVLWPQCPLSDILRYCPEYNVLGVVAKKQAQLVLNEKNNLNLKWINKLTKTREPESALRAFFSPSISPRHAQTERELETITAQAIQLSEVDFHNLLKEKSIKMMDSILRKEKYDTHTRRLAFSEINNQFQYCINQFREQLKSQDSKFQQEPEIEKKEINQLPINPLPNIDSEITWDLWLSQSIAERNTIDVAFDMLEVRVKELTNEWETDFLRYNVLTKLALHWVEALQWGAVSTNVSIIKASQQIITRLVNCNKVIARRYHPDKNGGANEEIMKSFNSCRDKATESILDAQNEEICPEWIQSLTDKDPNLFMNNRRAAAVRNQLEKNNIMRMELSEIRKAFEKDCEDSAKKTEQFKQDFAKDCEDYAKKSDDSAKKIEQLKQSLAKDREDRLKMDKMQAQNTSTRPFFAKNNEIFKPQQRYPVTTLSPEHQQLLNDNHWEITQPSEDKCNFFTTLASEINRVKKKQGADEFTEKSLRKFCSQFYSKNNRNKNIVTNLNESYQTIDEDTFHKDRKDNYQCIEFDASTINEKSTIIKGHCRVEGVIILRFYKLVSIYEMSIDKDNQIQYALVKNEGYQSCTEEEFNQKSKYSPILLKVEGNYYIASKQKRPGNEKESIEDCIKTPKSTNQVNQFSNNGNSDTLDLNNFTF